MAGQGVIQAELSIELGKYLAALNQAQAAIAKYAAEAGGSMQAANQAYVQSTDKSSASTKSLTKTLSDFKGEQVQQARQAKYFANTLAEIIPASDGAKSALAGLISIGLEGAAGGLGFGLVLEVVTLVSSQIQRVVGQTEEAKKKATEWGVEMRKELISMTDKARDLADELANVTPTQKAQRVTENTQAAVDRLAAEEATIRARQARMLSLSGKPNTPKEVEEYVGNASIFSTSQAEQDRIRLKAIEEGIADSRTKSIGVLRAEAAAAKVIADLTKEKADSALRAALSESKAAGNVDYEMAGGDGGVLVVQQRIDALRASYEQAGATAATSVAKARGASEQEVEVLRVKAEMIGLNAQLTAASSSAEIASIRKRIAALKEESRLKLEGMAHRLDPMFGPGNDEGERGFQADKTVQDGIQKQNEREAESYDAGTFDLSGISASQVAMQRLSETVASTRDSFTQLGAGIGSAFSSIGSAIGGAAGEFISQVGAMIAQTIALVLALAFSDTLMTGPLGVFAAVPMAAGILASLIAMIASVPSFDVGTLSVPRTGLAMVHAGEAILPAGGPAETYRAGLARTGGVAPASRSTNVNVTLNVTAMDGQSVYRVITDNRGQVARAFREMARDGVS